METSGDQHMVIILEPGKPPRFEGDWTAGQARQMFMAALQWLDGLPLMTNKPPEVENG